ANARADERPLVLDQRHALLRLELARVLEQIGVERLVEREAIEAEPARVREYRRAASDRHTRFTLDKRTPLVAVDLQHHRDGPALRRALPRIDEEAALRQDDGVAVTPALHQRVPRLRDPRAGDARD